MPEPSPSEPGTAAQRAKKANVNPFEKGGERRRAGGKGARATMGRP